MTTTQDSLSDPLTPPDCDLQDFAFMPLDVRRLRDSDLASDETPEACWAAVLLWAAAWHQVPAASIPDSDQWQAKVAGYVARGAIDKAWRKVREGALRGWVRCSDGRLYHPVVAEKANDAWISKLRQRWRTEVERVRKSNARNQPAPPAPIPTFEEFVLRLPASSVPRDMRQVSHGTGVCVPRDSGADSAGQPGDVPPVSDGFGVQERGIGTERGTGTGRSISLAETDSVVVVVDFQSGGGQGAPPEKFGMFMDWSPDAPERFYRAMFDSGIFLSEDRYAALLHEFRMYWRSRPDVAGTQAWWESQLTKRAEEIYRRIRDAEDEQHGG